MVHYGLGCSADRCSMFHLFLALLVFLASSAVSRHDTEQYGTWTRGRTPPLSRQVFSRPFALVRFATLLFGSLTKPRVAAGATMFAPGRERKFLSVRIGTFARSNPTSISRLPRNFNDGEETNPNHTPGGFDPFGRKAFKSQ